MSSLGRVYKIPIDAISVTTDADQDIFEIVPGANRDIILHGFSLTSSHATDERVRLRLCRRTTTGSGGSAGSKNEAHPGNTVVMDGSVNLLVTTPGTIGEILGGWQWSQQGELLYLPTPEIRDVAVKGGDRLCLNLQTAVGSTRTWSGWVAVEEV